MIQETLVQNQMIEIHEHTKNKDKEITNITLYLPSSLSPKSDPSLAHPIREGRLEGVREGALGGDHGALDGDFRRQRSVCSEPGESDHGQDEVVCFGEHSEL